MNYKHFKKSADSLGTFIKQDLVAVPTALLIHKEGATSPTLNSDDRRSLNAEICYNKIQQCVAFEVHIFCGTIIQ